MSYKSDSDSCRPDAEQTAIAISQNERWLYFILSLNFPTTEDTALFIDKNLDAWQAIKLDGGGSSQLWYSGWIDQKKPDNKIVVEQDRWLSQYLAIYADPDPGIEITPTPIPTPIPLPVPTPTHPPGDGGGLFDWFTDWWQNSWLNQLIQDFLDLINSATSALDAFNQFLKNIRDPEWWTQQLLNWTGECLGSLALPAGLVALGWGLLRRRH